MDSVSPRRPRRDEESDQTYCISFTYSISNLTLHSTRHSMNKAYYAYLLHNVQTPVTTVEPLLSHCALTGLHSTVEIGSDYCHVFIPYCEYKNTNSLFNRPRTHSL